MIIEVLYFAEIEKITQKEKERFILSRGTLKSLISLLLKKYQGLREIIWDDMLNNLSNIISVIINNRAVHGRNVLSKELKDGDKVAFLLPISGG